MAAKKGSVKIICFFDTQHNLLIKAQYENKKYNGKQERLRNTKAGT